MEVRHLIHTIVLGLFATAFFAGCSIRTIPFDQPFDEEQEAYEMEEAMYREYYPRGIDTPPPGFSYDAWQMSQYYQYANEMPYRGYASDFGYLPAERLNVDPNPNDSYRSGEAPLRRAPSQYSLQPTDPSRQSDRRTEQRHNDDSFQQPANRSRQAHSNSPSNGHDDRSSTREQLKQRRRQSENTTLDEDREAQRRKVRQRMQR